MSSSLTNIGMRCVQVQAALNEHTSGRQPSLDPVQQALDAFQAEIRFYELISPLDQGIGLYSKMATTFEEVIGSLREKSISPSSSWGRLSAHPQLQEMHARLSQEFDLDIVNQCFRYSAFLRHLDLLPSSSPAASSSSSAPPSNSLSNEKIENELRFRIANVTEFTFLWLQLFESRPNLPAPKEMYKSFQEMIFSFYRYPQLYTLESSGCKEKMRVTNLMEFMRIISQCPMKDEDVAFLLKVAMSQYAQVIPAQDIKQGAKLLGLYRTVQVLMQEGSLCPEAFYASCHTDKKMYLIRNDEGTILGKLKTFDSKSTANNVYRNEMLGYAYDQLLSAGMTCPTRVALRPPLNLKKQLEDCSQLFKKNESSRAKSIFDKLPETVKNHVYGWLYKVQEPSFSWLSYGQHAFEESHGVTASDEERAMSIASYLESQEYQCYLKSREYKRLYSGHAETEDHQSGILQLWRASENALTLLETQPGIGAMLREIPVTMAHQYAVLEWVKGSKDCNLSNTLLQLQEVPISGTEPSSSAAPQSTRRVVNLLDCDDEHLLGLNFLGTSEDLATPFLHLWPLGLPQNAEPFSQAELFLLATSNMSQRVQQWNRAQHWIEPDALEAQKIRVTALEARARDALTSGTSFSLRDLYRETIPDAGRLEKELRFLPAVLAYDPPRSMLWHGDCRKPIFEQNINELYSAPQQTEAVEPHQNGTTFVQDHSSPQGHDSQ